VSDNPKNNKLQTRKKKNTIKEREEVQDGKEDIEVSCGGRRE